MKDQIQEQVEGAVDRFTGGDDVRERERRTQLVFVSLFRSREAEMVVAAAMAVVAEEEVVVVVVMADRVHSLFL